LSIFGDIWNKITGSEVNAGTPAAAVTTDASSAATASNTGSATPAPAAMSEVDVEVILVNLATQKGGDSNWRTSIVDLLKVLDLDSSLSARKELASELNVHAGADGTPEQNTALHRAVMHKLEENGGKVPDSMKS
jgi:hypothetical protein